MLINGGNYFHEKAFNDICKALQKGEMVEVYIDCLGHTRNNIEQETYKEELLKKYQNNLMVERTDGTYSYSYSYRLKDVAGGGENV